MKLLIEDFLRQPMDENAGGEGEGAPDAGGTLVGGVGETGAEGEGTPGEAEPAAGDAAAAGENQDSATQPEGEGDNDQPAGAPESYEDFKVPEGYELGSEQLTEFTEYAKANNWTQEQAQQAIDYHSKQLGATLQQQEEAWNETRKQWVDAVKADKEVGGQAFAENMKHVAVAVQKFGTPGLREILNQSGVGDHPELVRFFYRVGKLAGEGEFHTGQGDTVGEQDPASVLYPEMNR